MPDQPPPAPLDPAVPTPATDSDALVKRKRPLSAAALGARILVIDAPLRMMLAALLAGAAIRAGATEPMPEPLLWEAAMVAVLAWTGVDLHRNARRAARH